MYLEIDEDFPTHPKSSRLCAALGNPVAWAYMIRLWAWARKYQKDGDLIGYEPAELEFSIGWQAADGKLLSAAVRAGFVDETRDAAGNVVSRRIHNWMDRTGGAVRKMENEAARKRLLRLHKAKQCDPATCQFHRRAEDDPGMSDGRPEDAPPPDDGHPTASSDQDKSRQVQARSGSGSLSSGSESGSHGNPAGARSETRASWPPPLAANSALHHAHRPRVYLAAKTDAFRRVFALYPRRDKENVASQVFQEIAETYQGGEEALAAAIEASFARGLLNRHPYAGPNATRPCFDTFLAERRWEDPESAPDNGPTGKPWEQQQREQEHRKGIDRAQARKAQQQLERELAAVDGKAAG